jgi:hypothetical protein
MGKRKTISMMASLLMYARPELSGANDRYSAAAGSQLAARIAAQGPPHIVTGDANVAAACEAVSSEVGSLSAQDKQALGPRDFVAIP